MKGCYGIVMYYVRWLAILLCPFVLIAAGMAYNHPVTVGQVVITANPVATTLAGLVLYAIAVKVRRR